MSGTGHVRVLALARSYPNLLMPILGLWSQRLLHCTAGFADTKVISPVPWAPPLGALPQLQDFTRFRRIPRTAFDGKLDVLHPRMVVGPGSTTYPIESGSYALAAMRTARRIRPRFEFDLIHAHFLYPDGVAACVLGRRYRVPVVITELVPWDRTLQRSPLVRRQAAWAARTCDALVPESDYVRRSIEAVLGVSPGPPVPLVLDDAVLQPPGRAPRKPAQLLFVGVVRRIKGLDILVEALALLRARHPNLRLVVAGEPFFRSYKKDFDEVMERARALGVDRMIDIVGRKSPSEVASLMTESSVLVVPSRAESFCSVIIEALACGTPVVATRCGGPEELLNSELGMLVPPEDPHAFAEAVEAVLDDPARYDPTALREHALARYAPDVVARQICATYAGVLERRVASPRLPAEVVSSAP